MKIVLHLGQVLDELLQLLWGEPIVWDPLWAVLAALQGCQLDGTVSSLGFWDAGQSSWSPVGISLFPAFVVLLHLGGWVR